MLLEENTMKRIFALAVCILLLTAAVSRAEVKAGPNWSGIFQTQLAFLDNRDRKSVV